MAAVKFKLDNLLARYASFSSFHANGFEAAKPRRNVEKENTGKSARKFDHGNVGQTASFSLRITQYARIVPYS